MRLKYSFLLVVLCLLAAVALTGQNIPEDEIRIGSRPYVPTAPNTLRVKSNLVEVPVVVRDERGKAIGGLQRDSFEVDDRGKRQTISFFAVELAPRMSLTQIGTAPTLGQAPAPVSPAPMRQPRYVAFYFDDFSMPLGDLNSSRDAAMQFVREDIEPGDKAGVFTSSTTVFQEFTEDKQTLLNALGQIRTHQRRTNEGLSACPNLTPIQAYQLMQTYNSTSDDLDLGIAQAIACHVCSTRQSCVPFVLAAARETLAASEQISGDTFGIVNDVTLHLSKMPGKRMLVVASSGFMAQTNGPKHYQEKVIEAALRANIVINSLDAKGLWSAPPGGDITEQTNRPRGVPVGAMRASLAAYQDSLEDMQKMVNDDPLAAMAAGTGGRFFHNSNDLGRGFRELAMPPEVSYVLGFTPENTKTDGAFHDLKVKLISSHGLSVEARRGYFVPAPPTKTEIDSAAKLERLDHQVLADDKLTDVTADFTTETTKLENGALALKVAIHVDVGELPFQMRNERHVERLIFITALFDSENRFLAGVQQVMDLSLKDATLAQVSARGLTANLSMQAPPGSYRLREVVQETGSGRIGALSKTVEIR
jgi:VWFA-related protein